MLKFDNEQRYSIHRLHNKNGFSSELFLFKAAFVIDRMLLEAYWKYIET